MSVLGVVVEVYSSDSAQTTFRAGLTDARLVIEMFTHATALAGRCGIRSINTDDLIILTRHDRAEVSRLLTVLGWYFRLPSYLTLVDLLPQFRPSQPLFTITRPGKPRSWAGTAFMRPLSALLTQSMLYICKAVL